MITFELKNNTPIPYDRLDAAVSQDEVELVLVDDLYNQPFNFRAGINSPAGHRITVKNGTGKPIRLYGSDNIDPLPDEGAASWRGRKAVADYAIVNHSPVVDFDGGMWAGFDIRGWGRGGINHRGRGNSYRNISIQGNGEAEKRTVEVTGKNGYVPVHKHCAIRINSSHATFENLEVIDSAADVFQVGNIRHVEHITVDGYLFTYRMHKDGDRAYNDTVHPDDWQTWKVGTVAQNIRFKNGIMGVARQWLIFGNASEVRGVSVENSVLVDAYGVGFQVKDECDQVLVKDCTIYTADKSLLLAWCESSRKGQFTFDNCILYSANGRFKVDAEKSAHIQAVNCLSNKVIDGMATTVQPIRFKREPSGFGELDFDFANPYSQGANIHTVADVVGRVEPEPEPDHKIEQIETALAAVQQELTKVKEEVAHNTRVTEHVVAWATSYAQEQSDGTD